MLTLAKTKEINRVDIKGYSVIIDEVASEDNVSYIVTLKYPKGYAVIEQVEQVKDKAKAYEKAFNLVSLVINWKIKL